jgi:hypothetical protein
MPEYKINSILNKVFSNLILNNDILKLRLKFERKEITREKYDNLESYYLKEVGEYNIDVLKNDIYILMKLSNKVFNTEEISIMFNCSREIANIAINSIVLEG